MKTNTKLLNWSLMTAASVVALSWGAPAALAQDTTVDETKTLDTVVVTGYRQSLADALELKRNSNNVVDAISAEDIGKSTDQNIAEALQRVTGIAINRQDGEGTEVTVRGLNANLNNVTLNGVPLTSSGDSQGVNFSEFSADILQSIEVQKTPSASTDEGSLGASIRLSGFKPLNARKDRRVFEYQARYNDFSDGDLDLHKITGGGDFKASLSLSEKFFDDRVGVSLVASREKQGGRRDRVNTGGWRVRSRFSNGANVDGLGIVDAYDVNGDGIIDVNLDGDATPNENDNDRELAAWAPDMLQYRYELNQRDRDSAQLGFQFKLWDGSDISISSTFTDQLIGRDQSFIQANNRDNQVANPADVLINPETRNAYIFVEEAYPRPNDFTTARGLSNVGVWRHGRDVFDDNQQTWVHSFDAKQEWGEFDFSLRGGHSETTQEDDFNLRSFWRADRTFSNNTEPFQGSGLRAGTVCDNPGGDLHCRIVTTPGNPDFTSPDGSTPFADQVALFDYGPLFEPQAFSDQKRSSEDTNSSIYFDVEWNRGFGPITSLEVGGKWSSREKIVNQENVSCGQSCLTDTDGNNLVRDLRLEGVQDGTVPTDFLSGAGYGRDDQTDGWPIIDIFAVADIIQQAEVEGKITSVLNPVSVRGIEQEAWAAYAQANFSALDDRLFGDFGIRYAETEITGTGPSFVDLDAAQAFGLDAETSQYYIDNFASVTNVVEAEAFHNSVFLPLTGLPAVGSSNRNGQSARFSVQEFNSYENWLPSLNVNYAVRDDVILRFAASETIARPAFNDLFPRFDINESIFGERSSGNIGATSLQPFKSQNLDFSAEWYFREGSLFSVAVFKKELSDFTQRAAFESFYQDFRGTYWDLANAVLDEERGGIRARPFTAEEVLANGDVGPSTAVLIPLDGSGTAPGCMPNRENDVANEGFSAGEFCDVVLFTQTQNGSGGYVQGVELGVTHDFADMLPGIWSGLGFTANYTYADSRADEQPNLDANGVDLGNPLPEAPLENTSEHSYNATLYWEKDGHLVRLAYSGRSDFLQQRISREMSTWQEGFDSLDLSGNIKLNDNFTLNFQAINLLDSKSRRYQTVRQPVTLGTGEVLPAETSVLGDQYTGRTSEVWNTGTIYRMGIRASF